MSILEKEKNILVGHIKATKIDQIIGSCIPFTYKNDIFIITCSHVIYNDNSSELRYNKIDLEVEVNSIKYELIDILGDIESSKATDLSVVKIKGKEPNYECSFFELELFEVKDNTYLSQSKICIFPVFDERAQAVDNVKYAGELDKFLFSVKVDKDSFYNINQGASGASQYKGISGSGLFCEYNGKLYLQGVVKAIANTTVNTEVNLIDVGAFSTIFDDIKISNSFEKEHPQLHHNSTFNSDTSRTNLTRQLLQHLSDGKNKVLVCAPSDDSSSVQAKLIYSKLIDKLDEEKINYSVGGGKDHLFAKGSYPHIEEIEFVFSSECSTLIIIADDHSTFSQLSLLSTSIFNNPSVSPEVYVFYDDNITISQSFIKNGPFKFAEERVRARSYKFSDFDNSIINDVVSGIQSHHICLGKIA